MKLESCSQLLLYQWILPRALDSYSRGAVSVGINNLYHNVQTIIDVITVKHSNCIDLVFLCALAVLWGSSLQSAVRSPYEGWAWCYMRCLKKTTNA